VQDDCFLASHKKLDALRLTNYAPIIARGWIPSSANREGLMMVHGAQLEESKLASVRIPSEVCDRIDFLMDSLRSGILEASCRRAQARTGRPNANRVTEQDCLQSACDVLRKTSVELERLLTESTGHYGQVRNAS
jgi:hypothetical protein